MKLILALVICLCPAVSLACMRPQPEFMAKSFKYVDLVEITEEGKIKKIGAEDYIVTTMAKTIDSSSNGSVNFSAAWSFRRIGGFDTCSHNYKHVDTDVRGYYIVLRKSSSMSMPRPGQTDKALFGPFDKQEGVERFSAILQLMNSSP